MDDDRRLAAEREACYDAVKALIRRIPGCDHYQTGYREGLDDALKAIRKLGPLEYELAREP